MTEFSKNSFATIQFTLNWKSDYGDHEEQYLARKINFWRDILPEKLESELAGKKTGDVVSVYFQPGEGLAEPDRSKIIAVPLRKFSIRFHDAKDQPPRKGRFYPQGSITGIPGVYPQTAVPFRVLNVENNELVADLNHPLSGIPFELSAEVLNIADKDSETGGRLTHWIEEMCNWGPGMQAPLENCPTDFIHGDFYRRQDNEDDSVFYSSPRLIGHVDYQASRNLQDIYSRFLAPGMKVLDLMSSMKSHLPGDLDLDVTGLGMNMDELKMNPDLNTRITQDLNLNPVMNLSPDSFDAVICSLSIEYLTDPLSVLRQAYQSLSSGGVLLVGISNRWFPSKVTQGWLEMHEFERMGYLLQLAQEAGFKGSKGTVSVRNDWRPVNDKHFLATRGVSDPVYVVWCRKD